MLKYLSQTIINVGKVDIETKKKILINTGILFVAANLFMCITLIIACAMELAGVIKLSKDVEICIVIIESMIIDVCTISYLIIKVNKYAADKKE